MEWRRGLREQQKKLQVAYRELILMPLVSSLTRPFNWVGTQILSYSKCVFPLNLYKSLGTFLIALLNNE